MIISDYLEGSLPSGNLGNHVYEYQVNTIPLRLFDFSHYFLMIFTQNDILQICIS